MSILTRSSWWFIFFKFNCIVNLGLLCGQKTFLLYIFSVTAGMDKLYFPACSEYLYFISRGWQKLNAVLCHPNLPIPPNFVLFLFAVTFIPSFFCNLILMKAKFFFDKVILIVPRQTYVTHFFRFQLVFYQSSIFPTELTLQANNTDWSNLIEAAVRCFVLFR